MSIICGCMDTRCHIQTIPTQLYHYATSWCLYLPQSLKYGHIWTESTIDGWSMLLLLLVYAPVNNVQCTYQPSTISQNHCISRDWHRIEKIMPSLPGGREGDRGQGPPRQLCHSLVTYFYMSLQKLRKGKISLLGVENSRAPWLLLHHHITIIETRKFALYLNNNIML